MGNVLNFAPKPRNPVRLTPEQQAYVAAGRATHSALNVRTPRTIQTGYGMLCRVFVIAMPSDGIRIYDAASWERVDSPIVTLSEYEPVITLNRECKHGITIDPGQGGIVTCTFN
ncbi:hypothetical protein [Paraburkholderia sp. C35]|uniref:hypothetical protein n=1 Tax=Paraburkholderia sp. C35 TaxID=2126993 RepID=UPI000D692ED0|nr:hypothetical protein [Paraburkholderia sp. C35]